MKRKILSLVTSVFAASAALFAVSCANTDKATNKSQHAYASIAEVPATCLSKGVAAHYECVECGKLFVKNDDGKYTEVTEGQLDTALAEHEYSAVAETQSTCSKAGAPAHYEYRVLQMGD